MLDMFIGGFRAPDHGHFKGICMSVALWIVLLVCVLWIALSEMPAGWDGHLPLPYLIALTPLLWIPTLAIAIAGAVRHDTALAIRCEKSTIVNGLDVPARATVHIRHPWLAW